MARIEETEEGVTTDIIAPKIVIDWNPILNDGPVFFHMERMVRGPEGQLLSMTHEAIMPKKISDILQRTITLNIGGNDVEFQGALLMGLIKQVFDDLYIEDYVQVPVENPPEVTGPPLDGGEPVPPSDIPEPETPYDGNP